MVRPKTQKSSGAKRRKVKDDFFAEDEGDDEAVFMGSDDEAKAGAESEDEEDAEERETAEQKRLRLAKAYLDNIKRLQAEEGDGGSDDEELAERLRQDAMDSLGHFRRKIAHRVILPPLPRVEDFTPTVTGGRLLRGHRLSVTATALTADDRTLYSVSKDGTILEHDIETGQRRRFGIGYTPDAAAATGGADWVAPAARQGSKSALLAAAVSSDGRYLAAGGGDKKVHVWDARSGAHLRAFPGHKDNISALAFREGTSQLFSGSLDRSIKIWSLEDMGYVDTLFGHQAEVLCLDVLRAEKVLSCGADRTCRQWKVADEAQLVFRGHCLTIESCALVGGGEWVSGSADGSVSLWRAAKKKPVWTIRDAHGGSGEKAQEAAAAAVGAGSVGGAASTWVGAVAVGRGTNLVATGAGDGIVCLWGSPESTDRALTPLGGVAVRGFVNSLHVARSGRFLVAGVGQEPRMGRWLRDPVARNGVVVHPIELAGAVEGGAADAEGVSSDDDAEI